MTTHSHVPADVEPDSFSDLLEDCREVSGVLAPWISGSARLPSQRGVMPVEIPQGAVIDLDGYGDYGC